MNQYLYDPNNPPAPAIEAKLRALGVRFVLATPMPSADGMVAEEREPVLDGDVWRQVWELVPVPAPPAPPMPELNRKQWVFLQYQPEIAPLFALVEAAMKDAAPIEYAALMAYKASDGALWDIVFALVSSFAPLSPEGVEITEEFLAPIWMRAASF